MKRRHHIYVKGLVILAIHFLMSFPIFSQGMFTVEDFMGVNINRGDNPDMMTCAGIIREFHDWSIDEGNIFAAGQASPPFPNQEFRWNPGYQGQSELRFDDWYDAINAQNVGICATMHLSLPRYSLADGNNFDGRQVLPIEWYFDGGNLASTDDREDSESYKERADWIYHFITRYGAGSTVPECRLKYGPPEETSATNRGNITYLESWNEPDKWWLDCVNARFTAAEYAAMASADFDGHLSSVFATVEGDCNGDGTTETNTYAVGIRNAGSNTKFVMGGTFELNWAWVEDMNQWFIDNRPDKQFIFDVINFHHYSFKASNGMTECYTGPNINIGTWISPEEDNLKGLLAEIVALRDAQFPGKELWLSEFGYDTNQSNNGNGNGPDFLSIGDENNPLSAEELQAQWTVRSFLEIAAAGFDRAMVHDLQDGSSNPIAAWDNNTGLVTEGGVAKQAWYYVSTMRNVLAGTRFEEEVPPENCSGTEFNCETKCARVYKFENGQGCPDGITWAVWSPTSCDKDVYEYNLPLECDNGAVGIFMEAPFTQGVRQQLDVEFNEQTGRWEAIVPVSETPVFVQELKGKADVPLCVNGLEATAIDCSTAEVTWEIPDGQQYDSYQVWYGAANQVTNPSSPDYTQLTNITQNLGGNETSVLIGGLGANTEYVIYVLPQNENGVPVDLGTGQVIWCSTSVTTTGELCQIVITEDMIYCDDPQGPAITELFDEQQNINFCGVAPSGQMPSPTNEWVHFILPDQMMTVACLDLGEPHDLSHFYMYDATDAGEFQIEWSADGQGNWQPLGTYFTGLLEEWVLFTDFVLPDGGVRFLRFTNIDNVGRLGELIICGEPTDDIPIEDCDIIKFSAEVSEDNCPEIELEWVVSDANCSFKEFQVWYQTSTDGDCSPTLPNDVIPVTGEIVGEGIVFNSSFSDVKEGMCYCFYVQGILQDGSVTTLWNSSTCVDICPSDCTLEMLEGMPLENCNVELNWAVNQANDCTIKGYELFYHEGTNCSPSPPQNAIEVIDVPDFDDTFFEVLGLDPNTCYCFYLRGIDEEVRFTNWATINVCSKCEEVCACENVIELRDEKNVTLEFGDNDWFYEPSISGNNEPNNMIDEQEFIYEICKTDICGDPLEGTVPETEWFVPWNATDATVTMTFLDGPYLVNDIYIFDTNNEGLINFKGKTPSGTIVDLTPDPESHKTKKFITWCSVYEGDAIELTGLIISREDKARFAELAICGTKKERGGRQPLLSYPEDPEFFPIVFPNPNTGIMKIERKDGRYEHVQIYNTMGQPVHAETFEKEEHVLDLGILSPGIYWFRFTGEQIRPYSTKVFIVKEDY